MSDPKPSFEKTYRMADGDPVADWGWVTGLEHFEDDDEPVELIEETWERTAVRTFWHMPTNLYSCGYGNCEEDAVGWSRSDDGSEWAQVCADHDDGTAVRP